MIRLRRLSRSSTQLRSLHTSCKSISPSRSTCGSRLQLRSAVPRSSSQPLRLQFPPRRKGARRPGPSRRDRLQLVTRDAQRRERVFAIGVRPQAHARAVAPARDLREGHRGVEPALPSAPVHHGKHERLLAEVEVRLALDADLVAPRLLELLIPSPQPVRGIRSRRQPRQISSETRSAGRSRRGIHPSRAD